MNEYMDNKKKGNWSNTEGFISKEGININLASSKTDTEAVSYTHLTLPTTMWV